MGCTDTGFRNKALPVYFLLVIICESMYKCVQQKTRPLFQENQQRLP